VTYFPNAERKIPLGRPARYPWNLWTDGTERLLVEGVDFACMAESFVLLARRTASVRGLKAHVSRHVLTERAKPETIEINDQEVRLEPGNTYVVLKFSPVT
jgi:hypothetical protein